MFSKGLSISRGLSVAAAALAAAACVGLASTAVHASVIYQDNFTGSSTLGTLNGAAPTVDNGTSSTWTASSAWADSGYTTNSTGQRQNAYLAFTPAPGHVYTLTVRLDVTGEGSSSGQPDSNYWAALGFMTTPATTGGWDGGGASLA